MAFPVDQQRRDAWMGHMGSALEALDLAPDVAAAMRRYFEDAATFLINRAESDPERLPLRGVPGPRQP
jgi:truncated hemoglobin YjbI